MKSEGIGTGMGKGRGRQIRAVADADAGAGVALGVGSTRGHLVKLPERSPVSEAPPVTPAVVSLLTSALGYQVVSSRSAGSESVTVIAPDGRLCLSISLLHEGPVVEVRAQSLRLASEAVLRLDCDRLEINVTASDPA